MGVEVFRLEFLVVRPIGPSVRFLLSGIDSLSLIMYSSKGSGHSGRVGLLTDMEGYRDDRGFTKKLGVVDLLMLPFLGDVDEALSCKEGCCDATREKCVRLYVELFSKKRKSGEVVKENELVWKSLDSLKKDFKMTSAWCNKAERRET
ncbi:hypothetical protein VNO78_21762 [Psophocarpus tetragonolobus]|uniref:Uncharacterized protein n=1 Tax=Psophocarpus tetragonolobus TaxID=3891 RepID=A0AAN9SC56_PSOTE